MKNLKISAKILLGYGVIMLLTLIFTGFVIFSSTTTVTNVNNIHSDSKLQTETKDLMMHFYEARVYARVMYVSNDSTAYDQVMSNLNEVIEHADEINALISESKNVAQYKEKADAAVALIDSWKENISKVNEANIAVDAIVAAAQESQTALTDKSMGLFNYQVELSRDEASQQIATDSRLRRIDRLEMGMHFGKNIDHVGSVFELILKTYDLSRVPESMQVLDDTITELQAFVDDSSLQYNIETGNALLVALAAYKDDINNFITTYNEREALINDAKSNGEQTLTALNDFLGDIDLAMETLAGATASTASTSLIMVIVIAAISLIFSVTFALFLSRMISRPIKKMHAVIDQVGTTGDLAFSPQTMDELHLEAQAKDEIGQSMRSFVSLIEHLSKTGDQLSRIADGDLTVDVQLLSERDTISTALSTMIDNLNRMFGEIYTSTSQVSTGSKQIADGAQSLAQGSTEQAAAVQQLSASISEIAQKTHGNAETAGRAATLADTIKQSAEKGSRQMDQMMVAVKDINQASQNINKVIKAIDDIAFQTNILALNAAVEAARAGQHGKGFAVVAEEVRNLAAKSSEAAKDTGGLIADSMEKAELGARIAGETAASLAEIVDGINESSRLVGDIAKSSEEQSMGIAEINKGIDQVAQVVQQNSATSEQSAAASQELNGQSDMLEQMISQFRLKNREASKRSLPAPKKTTYSLPADSGDFGKY